MVLALIIFFIFLRIILFSTSYERETNLNINYVEENLYSLDQSDPQLIQYTRIRHLNPPSILPYNLEGSSVNYKDEFSGWVAEFFENKVSFN